MLILLSLALASLLGACNNGGDHQDAQPATSGQTAATEAAPASAAQPSGWTGEILETMDAGGYTYIQLDTGSQKIWAAAPQTKVEVGQRVTVPRGMLMTDFPSKTLDRTFDEIWFVGGIYPEGHVAAGSEHPVGGGSEHPTSGGSEHPTGDMTGMGGTSAHNMVADAGVSGVEKLAGGYDIAGIYAAKADLAGKTVKVRGRVVKFTPRVMGVNWIHIQDGSGSGKTADLTVTSDAEVQAGDLVVVEGTLSADKDFGAGYKYSAIIENATVTKE